MEGSLGVSLYLSRIQQEIIAEGGTQTSPSLRYNHFYLPQRAEANKKEQYGLGKSKGFKMIPSCNSYPPENVLKMDI
jgi:hypothetical protein